MTTGIFSQENEKTVPPSDVISWCSIPQAISWMETGGFAPKNEFDGLLRSCLHGGADLFTSYPTFWHKPGSSVFRLKLDTWQRLLNLIRNGIIRLRGRPGISFRGAHFINGYHRNDFIMVECVDWGIPEFIDHNSIPDGLLDPEAPGDLGFVCEGWLICGLHPESMSFSYVEIDFCALKNEVFSAPPSGAPPTECDHDLNDANVNRKYKEKQRVAENKPRASLVKCGGAEGVNIEKLLNSASVGTLVPGGGNISGAIRTQDAARYLGISKSTLEKYRSHGGGPTYKKIGKICVYAIDDLDRWLELKSKSSTSG